MISVYHIFGTIPSLKKDKTSFIQTFSKRSVKQFTLKNCLLMRAKDLHFMRMCLTVQGVWHVKHSGCCCCCCCFSMKEWVSLVWPMRNRDIMTCSFDFLKVGRRFSQNELDLEEFNVDIIIPALLLFIMKEFINFGFQGSIWNPEFVGGQIYGRFGYRVCSFISSHSNAAWNPVHNYFYTISMIRFQLITFFQFYCGQDEWLNGLLTHWWEPITYYNTGSELTSK